MAILKFKREEVKRLVEHSQKHPLMSPTFDHLTDKKYWKPGAQPGNFGAVKPEEVDATLIEPYLYLVKDSGIYLMSGSATKLDEESTANCVAYAEGLGADADYDAVVDAVGGDDFAEALPLTWFADSLQPGTTIRLSITATSIKRLK